LKKAEESEERYMKLCVERNFRGVLEQVHVILEEVEAELAKHTRGEFHWRIEGFCITDLQIKRTGGCARAGSRSRT
jgi:hypothetical protein